MPTQKDAILKFLSDNIRRAKNRGDGKEITLTANEAYEVGVIQKWRCAGTKMKLEFVRGGTYYGGKWCNPLSCSIDRIDNTKGYTKDNIQLVTWAFNNARRNTDLNEFKKYMGLK